MGNATADVGRFKALRRAGQCATSRRRQSETSSATSSLTGSCQAAGARRQLNRLACSEAAAGSSLGIVTIPAANGISHSSARVSILEERLQVVDDDHHRCRQAFKLGDGGF